VSLVPMGDEQVGGGEVLEENKGRWSRSLKGRWREGNGGEQRRALDEIMRSAHGCLPPRRWGRALVLSCV
jgi:hypothetical protein